MTAIVKANVVIFLVTLACFKIEAHETCPPACLPPKTAAGCRAYMDIVDCDLSEKDISSSEADCGCFWQSYIHSIEPAARVIFTNDGNQCYVWAATVCTVQEKNAEFTLIKPLHNLMHKIEGLEKIGGDMLRREVAKSRKRNGVQLIKPKKSGKTTQKMSKGRLTNSSPSEMPPLPESEHEKEYFIGKGSKSESGEWFEVEPTKDMADDANLIDNPTADNSLPVKPSEDMRDMVDNPTENDSPQVDSSEDTQASGPIWTDNLTGDDISQTQQQRPILYIHHHWFDVNIQNDQFKLIVFLMIIVLDVIVVLVLIGCRKDVKGSNQKEALPMGDLDPNTYRPKDSPDRGHKGGFFDRFKRKDKSKQRKNSFTFLSDDDIDPRDFLLTQDRYHDSPSKRESRGLYENIDDHNNTYEVPMSIPPLLKDIHPKRYSLNPDSLSEGEDSSPTKYFPHQMDEQNRGVTFAMPPNAQVTMQDTEERVNPKRRKESGAAGTYAQFHMMSGGT